MGPKWGRASERVAKGRRKKEGNGWGEPKNPSFWHGTNGAGSTQAGLGGRHNRGNRKG